MLYFDLIVIEVSPKKLNCKYVSIGADNVLLPTSRYRK